jgi:hypothetical protein
VDISEVRALDVAWRAVVPRVGIAGVGMDAGDDDLLTVAHQLEALSFGAVGGDQFDRDLGEWRVGAKQKRAFWPLADPDRRVAADS